MNKWIFSEKDLFVITLVGLTLFFIVIITVFLSSPGLKTTTTMHGPPGASAVDTTRVDVERIGVFTDELAYQGRRGVYVIRDKATGREFIGVSGIGISEVGLHSQPVGKIISTLPDER